MTVSTNPSQASQQVAALSEKTNRALLKIIRDNSTSQYASKAPLLAEFRDAVSMHSGTEADATLLAEFRAHVPLSNYDSYKPFIDKFRTQPCRKEDVENMFFPGLPDFFAVSSGTSGAEPKILPKYNLDARLDASAPSVYDPNSKEVVALLVCTGYRDMKVIEHPAGEAAQRIPVCVATGGYVRRSLGWYVDNESRLSLMVPGSTVPWAATVIAHFPSFLVIHGLFFLANRDIARFRTTFATQFFDLISYIDKYWDDLVSCIRDGTLPELEGIDHVERYLKYNFHPDPKRAAELLEIGAPFSSEGWFSRVWPKATVLCTICSGPFATVLPRVKSILGPNASIRAIGYASSEVVIGPPYDVDKLDEFVLQTDDFIEFLDVSLDAVHQNLRQAWEVEAGKNYEPIITTREGLWRYRLGDVLHIIGFHPKSKSPLFKYVRRMASTIRFPFTQITDDQLLAAMQIFSSDDIFQVQEFTTVLDDRTLLPTVGFFVELSGPLGSNAYLAPQRLFDALAASNSELQHAFELGKMRLPTIQIVKAGTFGEYRHWKGKNANIVSGQIKVPLVLFGSTAQEWISERVVREL